MAPPHVNAFYRIWFTIIDPLVLTGTVLSCIFTPQTFLELVVPPHIAPYNPAHAVLMHQTAALYFFCLIMYGYLLPNSQDKFVWRTVQGATLVVDLSLLAALYVMLEQQGRLDPKTWAGLDWFNCGFTVWVALIRVAFLLEIGAEEDGAAAKVKKMR